MQYCILKRIFDLLISILLLPVLFVAIIIIWPIIYYTDNGPCFYCGKRIGKNGVVFKMYKFRTMICNAPDIRLPNGDTYNSTDDPRVTKIGKFLRNTSLDELPQIINVLRGDMSFVGPRPDPIDWLEHYREKDMIILTIRPGISGYCQAYFRNSVEELQKKEHDIYYVRNMSFMFDLRIIVKTISVVITRKNINRC